MNTEIKNLKFNDKFKKKVVVEERRNLILVKKVLESSSGEVFFIPPSPFSWKVRALHETFIYLVRCMLGLPQIVPKWLQLWMRA